MGLRIQSCSEIAVQGFADQGLECYTLGTGEVVCTGLVLCVSMSSEFNGCPCNMTIHMFGDVT